MSHRWVGVSVGLALTIGAAAWAAGGNPVYEKREETMKQLGKPFYISIGRVVRGTAEFGPDTVTAAEQVAALTKLIELGLFAPGSDGGSSKMKPEIFAASERVIQLTAAVQDSANRLVLAAKSGDKAAVAAAFKMASDACAACHNDYRRPE